MASPAGVACRFEEVRIVTSRAMRGSPPTMNWQALFTTLKLASITSLILMIIALPLSYWLAFSKRRWKFFVEAVVAMPLVLPPTVLGFYLLVAMGPQSPLGRFYEAIVGRGLPFTFEGLVVGSVLYSLPFAVQPMAAAFKSVDRKYIEASWMLGVSNLETFFRVIVPQSWAGVMTGLVLSFAHTIGEFGVVLMIGADIPGVTRTLSIDIYDQVQALNYSSAAITSGVLLILSFVILSIVYALNRKVWFFAADRRHRQAV
jgi:molybdate transport system permease protein